MQAETEASKVKTMVVGEADNPVRRSRAVHTIPTLCSPVLRHPTFDSESDRQIPETVSGICLLISSQIPETV